MQSTAFDQQTEPREAEPNGARLQRLRSARAEVSGAGSLIDLFEEVLPNKHD